MNQKDYKEIAGIMKMHIMDSKLKGICNDLASYFEREEIEKLNRNSKDGYQYTRARDFNRQQFLKDCGVEK